VSHRLVTHVRHVGLAVPDYDKQLDFYTNLWGLEEVSNDTGLSFLAAVGSPEQYIVRLRKASERRIDLLSLGAATPEDVDTLAAKLIADGVKLISEPGQVVTPGGGYGFRFFDVDGRTVEVSADVTARRHRKLEEKESIPVRLSHVVFNTDNPEQTLAFYRDKLGFALSDTIALPKVGEIVWFMRCSSRHHSIAFARSKTSSLNHVSFEMRGLDEFMRGTGRLLRAGANLMWGPGRHCAGENTFSYFVDPSGNTMEYTTELEELDEDTWHPHIYDMSKPEVQDEWGTATMNEDLSKETFNLPADPGAFVVPPV